MIRLRVAPEAEEELAAAADWYEVRHHGLGIALMFAIETALEEILNAPLSCGAWRADRPYRQKIVQRFPYVIFFVFAEETVTVLAIAHAHRRPGYWIGRYHGI